MKAKPFIKWVGGKSQLIEQLDYHLPANFKDWQDVTYIEPFVGGGAMLFFMLQKYNNIKHAIINDVNEDLTTCYLTVRDNPYELIESLTDIKNDFIQLKDEDSRKSFYFSAREKYNKKEGLSSVDTTTLFVFLNRTCFNGLYRVNSKGLFNVPFGKYSNPNICDKDTIIADSELLKRVEILNGDFELTFPHANGNTLFYFDPPYRPLSVTSSFTDYSKESFNDDSQIRLKNFCDIINNSGFSFLLSNSDCMNVNDDFFDVLYHDYNIDRVLASRSINSNPNKRGKLSEILVHNYNDIKGND